MPEENNEQDSTNKPPEENATPPLPPLEMPDFIDLIQQGKDIGDILDQISQELMATGVVYLEKLRRGQIISDAEQIRQAEMQKQLKMLQSIYGSMVKTNRIKGGDTTSNPNEKFNTGFLQKIKEKKSTIGSIVRNIDEKK